MKKLTIRDQLAAALVELGYEQVFSRTKRYDVYSHHTRSPRTVYLGKAGALRVGSTVSASIPHETWRQQLLASQRHKAMLDVHALRATEELGVSPEEVSSEQRARAKAKNFAELYSFGTSDFNGRRKS